MQPSGWKAHGNLSAPKMTGPPHYSTALEAGVAVLTSVIVGRCQHLRFASTTYTLSSWRSIHHSVLWLVPWLPMPTPRTASTMP